MLDEINMGKYREYTDEDIIEKSKEVTSIAQLLKALNLKTAGGNYANIKRNLQRLKIDTSHWTGKSWNKDKQLKDWSQYTRTTAIRKHLINTRGNTCECCGLSIWLDKPITLEVHHINGDRTNNNSDNLQLLCPNCHSLTTTWRKH